MDEPIVDEPSPGRAAGLQSRRRLPLTLVATLIEQGLFAGTNFLATILLVRWMAIDEVGAFSFGYSSFLLTAMIYEAVIIEPIPIVGSMKHSGRIGHYSGVAIYGSILAAGLASLALTALGLVCAVAQSPLLADATFGESEEHTSELQSPLNLVSRLLLQK